MAEHSREWWLHESEHVLVVLLLAVVLVQAVYLPGGSAEETATAEPVIIVPGHEAFTVYTGQVVQYPWLVVNRADEAVRVKSGLGLEWDHGPRNVSATPDGVTALLVEPAYGETAALGPGDHKTYRYTFTAPEKPGRYTLTVVAASNGATIKETVSMRVVPAE